MICTFCNKLITVPGTFIALIGDPNVKWVKCQECLDHEQAYDEITETEEKLRIGG